MFNEIRFMPAHYAGYDCFHYMGQAYLFTDGGLVIRYNY